VTAAGIIRSAAALAIGAAATVALYLALLNVPEANVTSLLLSAALVLLIVLAAGLTAGLAAALPAHGWRAALRRAAGGMPAFIAGLLVFAALFMGLNRLESWWGLHRGEVDAMLLPYIGTRSTAPLHAAFAWLLWLVRWVLGLSLVLGPVVAAAGGSARRGIRLALAAVPLVAMTLAAIILSQGVWRIVYWRPEGLPATSLEVPFVAAKLIVLYLVAAIVVGMVIGVYRRAARALIDAHPVRARL
jgi:hypothetical protein